MVFNIRGESSAINVRTALLLWVSAWEGFISQSRQSVVHEHLRCHRFELDGRAQGPSRVHSSSWPGWLIWVGIANHEVGQARRKAWNRCEFHALDACHGY